ncbi:MAG: tetratricopeptide repeat protein [Bacteroidota bacterium]|nr:tetratricopeptide repeat protein [Bacteroidota bacterium]
MRWQFWIIGILFIGIKAAGQHQATLAAQCSWDSLISAADAAKNSGDQKGALELLGQAWTIADELNDADMMIRTNSQRGLTYLNIGKYEKAWLHWTEAFAMAEKYQDMDAVAELHNYLGIARYHLKDHNEALDHFNQSLGLRKRIGTPYDLGVMLNNIASYEKDYGSPAKALQYFRESERHWELIGSPRWKATTYPTLAIVMRKWICRIARNGTTKPHLVLCRTTRAGQGKRRDCYNYWENGTLKMETCERRSKCASTVWVLRNARTISIILFRTACAYPRRMKERVTML